MLERVQIYSWILKQVQQTLFNWNNLKILVLLKTNMIEIELDYKSTETIYTTPKIF